MEELQPKLRFSEFKEDWSPKKLSQVANIGRGKSKHRPRDAEHLYGGPYPFIQTGDIRNAGLYLSSFSQTYSEAGLKQSKLWDENTLCITIAANIAETTILKIKACFPDSVIGLIPNEKDSIVLFIKYQFDKFKIEIQSLSQGVAQANLNQEKLSNIVFKFPDILEQTKIASFLSAVDEKLNLLKEKKAALEEYKKGMMQKIFSQEIRFKDENGQDFAEWEEKNLGEIANFLKGKGLPKSEIKESGKFKCIHYGELFLKYNELIQTIISYTNDNDNAILSVSNDILMPTSDVTPNGLATASCLREDGVILGGDILIIRQDKKIIDGQFFAYYISQYRNKVMKLVSGSTVYHLYGSDMSKLEIVVPQIQEQTKIASFLSAIDEKIELVSKQIEETQEYKKGLLQQMFV